MNDRNESVRDQIATIVQAGYSQRKTSVETADEIVARLERELAEANKELFAIRELVGVRGDCKAFASDAEHWLKIMAAWDENVKLRSQLVNAEKDTARLDWLADPANSIGIVSLPKKYVLNNLHCMRAAIDAAMEGGK